MILVCLPMRMMIMIQPKTLKLFKKIAKLVEPPPDISVSKWAEDNRVLSKESSAEPGKYRVSRAPYQEEIQDSINVLKYHM